MADTKISALSSASSITAPDLFTLVQSSLNKKITWLATQQSINISNITLGTLSDSLLSSNIPTLSAGANVFTGSISASNLSGFFSGTNTGDVTLGTANGLSLSGQVLGLGLSGSATVGALSSSDWNLFNSKQPAGSYVTSVTAGSPLLSSGGATPNITIPQASLSTDGYVSATDFTSFFNKLSNRDSLYALMNTSDITKLQKYDLSGQSTGTTLTISPLNTSNMVFNIPQIVTGGGAGMALTQDETTGYILGYGITSPIGGGHSMMQLANATVENRAQIKLHSYYNGASIAGVSTLTSSSGVIGINSAIATSQDYSKWTAQASPSAGAAPIVGTWAFKSAASGIFGNQVPSDYHIQLMNQAGTLEDKLYLTSEGALQLPGYGAGYAQFDSSGNVSSVTIVNSSATTTGFLTSTDWNLFNSKQSAGIYITALTGDVSATGPGSAAATVNSVGGSTAVHIHTAELAANSATAFNTPSTIVTRDASGNFAAGNITASLTGSVVGNVTGNVTGNVSGSSATFTGSLAGDVTGTQGATVLSATSNGTLTTLSALTSASALNTVGTITTGVWNGTAITVAKGGTGSTSFAINQLLLGGTTSTGPFQQVVAGTTGQVLTNTGATSAPTWQTPAPSGVTSVALTVPAFLSVSGSPITSSGTFAVTLSGTALPVANGGTGDTSFTTNQVVLGGTTTTGSLAQVTGGTSGLVLTSNGATAAPTWQTSPGITQLTGDVTAGPGSGSQAATVAAIQGKTVSGTTGTGNVVFSAAPTLTGLLSGGSASFTSTIAASNFSGTSSGTNTGDQTITLTGGVTGSGTGSFATTVVTNANLTGPVTSVGNATSVTTNSITNTMLAQMPANTIKGNNTGSTANATDLTVAQTQAMLSLAAQAKSSAFTAVCGNTYVLTGSNYAITLPDATLTTNTATINFIVSSNPVALSGPITFTTVSAQTIDGFSTYGLYTKRERIELISDGTNWQVIFHNTLTEELSDLTFNGNGSGFGTTTSNNFTYHREGSYIAVQGQFVIGVDTSAVISMNLPTNAQLDTTSYGAVGVLLWGGFMNNLHSAGVIDTSANALAYPFYDGANADGTKIYFCADTSNSSPSNYTKIVGTAGYITNSQPIAFRFVYPVSGWRA